MVAWMLYATLVGLCVVVAATTADWLARWRRIPVRYVWIVAALLCTLLPATAVLSPRRAAGVARERVELPDTFIRTSVLAVGRRVPQSATSYTAGLWSLAIILIAAPFGLVYASLRRASREWPEADLHGQRVRVSPAIGPVVIGAFRPDIVVPRWIFGRSADEQRLILAHEIAHIRARDPLVLTGACALVALMPWNPAIWFILSRLRLAIEIDCDARVLRAGASPQAYGSLLLDVAERALPLRLAMALSDGSSHLQQRIIAMSPRRIAHPGVRAASVALVGLASLFAACEAKMPTAAELDRMDVSAAEKDARALGVLEGDTNVVWLVDGVETTEAAAKAIPADSIVVVSLNKLDPSGSSHVYVVTKLGQQSALVFSGQPERVRRRMPQRDGKAVDPISAVATVVEREKPLVLIDGVRANAAAVKAMDPNRIAEMQILKGPNAIREYGDDAKAGVIVIKMKAAP